MKLTETERKEISALAVDTAVLIVLIAFLGYLVVSLLQPFAAIMLWAVILAVAVYPASHWLESRLGGRKGLAAFTLSLLLLIVVIGPAVVLGGSAIDSVKSIAASLSCIHESASATCPDLNRLGSPLSPGILGAADSSSK